MLITTLFENPTFYKDVSQMVFNQFVAGTSSQKTIQEVELFFQHTNVNTLPITFVAIMANQCVGTVSVFENDFKDRPHYTPWLASLYVCPEYRDQQIGQQLINYLLHHLKQLHYKEVFLKTENASAYYKKRGWEYIETVNEMDNHCADIFMYSL